MPRRCAAAVVVGLIVVGSAALFAGDAERFPIGTTLVYMPPERMIVEPAFTDLAAYRAWLSGARLDPDASLKRSAAVFQGIRSGEKVRVEGYIPGKQVNLSVATLRVTILQGSKTGQTAWTAAQHWRPKVDALPKGARPVPVYALARNAAHRPQPGERLFIHSPTGSQVWATTNIFAHGDKVRFVRAGDKKGLDDMIAAGRILMLDADQQILVVEYHGDNELVNAGEPVVEGRVLGGTNEGRLVWLAAHETAEYAVRCVWAPKQKR